MDDQKWRLILDEDQRWANVWLAMFVAIAVASAMVIVAVQVAEKHRTARACIQAGVFDQCAREGLL